MSKALLVLSTAAFSLLLSGCYESTESAADLSKQLEQAPTAAGPDCARNVSLMKQHGAPEAAIHGVSGCKQPGM